MSDADHRKQIEVALGMAFEAHAHEWRKGKNALPYMVHIFDIMRLARSIGIPISDAEFYQAIILHDVVESGYNLDIIAFDLPNVAPIVEELTFLGGPKDKPAYLESFAAKSLAALVVKILDRISNVWDFHEDGEVEYARKYLWKADALFSAMVERRGEIVDRWGSSVWGRLFKEYSRLRTAIDKGNQRAFQMKFVEQLEDSTDEPIVQLD
jgi:(p)ppGpp synthase/HD superfamily hydrolase